MILTDDEIDTICDRVLDTNGHTCGSLIAREVEAAVLAKLAKQEPVAMRYDFDGYGYQYIDSGSGSDWRSRIPYAEAVYAAPQQSDHQRAPQGWKLVPVEPTEKMCNPNDGNDVAAKMAAKYRQEIWSHMLAAAPEAPAQEENL